MALAVKKNENESPSVLFNSLRHHGLYSPRNSPGENTGVGSLSLLHGIPTRGLNPGLLHCRQILHQLNHKRSPVVKNLPPKARDIRIVGLIPGLGRSPGGGHDNPLQYSCLEKGMTTHSSILAWRIPWSEEPGEPWSKVSQRVRHS